MLLMVTNRRMRGGEYSDEEKPNSGFDYLYGHLNGPQGKDGFANKGRKGFETALLLELKRLKKEGVNTPKIGLYIHGYNNDYQDSIDEIYDLRSSLRTAIGHEPVIVGFSWPSTGKTARYLSDREEVRDSVPAFTRFLTDINEFIERNREECFSTSYCIAHSMGNYLLRKGMEYLSDHWGDPRGRMMFNETIMMAPDLAAKDIEEDGKGHYIANFSRRVHVYYSKFDRALKASSVKRFGQNRLGRHGANDYSNLPPNVVLVDAKEYANSESIKSQNLVDRKNKEVSVHSSHRYHPKILADAALVLSSVDRDLIETRKSVETPEGPSSNHYRLI